MFYKREKSKSTKILRGGGGLVALSLGVLMASVFGKISNAAPRPMGSNPSSPVRPLAKMSFSSGMDWIDGTGSTGNGPFKRKISDVSGNNSGPVSEKRLRLEFSTGKIGIVANANPDTWILQANEDGDEKIFLSNSEPKYWGINGRNFLYEINPPDSGKTKLVEVPMMSTGWVQNQDIIWTNSNQ